MAANMQLYVLDQNGKVLECKVFEFSSELFLYLAKSEFSAIGKTKEVEVGVDDEVVELRLVLISPVVRRALNEILSRCLVGLLKTSLDKMGDSPSRDEYQDYTRDLKELVKLIECLETEKYTHLDRRG